MLPAVLRDKVEDHPEAKAMAAVTLDLTSASRLHAVSNI